MKIKRILVANRGEIALRVIRTCHETGREAVAVYSDADRDAVFVREADYAVHIGGTRAAESYLVIDRILQAAADTDADAIHPGYGFLSENDEFARRVSEAGLIFIGPKPETIAEMGSKTAARQKMIAAGVPVVPGTEEEITDTDQALHVASEVGFPVMLKAAAGGGGKGMRVVNSEEDFQSALEAAQREALSSFGSDAVYIEKYLEEPHHIEVQILADSHGQVVHLFERECSIQRRHQKVIEETPSPFISEELRQKICEAAVQAARGADYLGAGTIEFLVDAHRNFYFLEMNTRLQVEHPVTEWITGVDLVAEQIQIAEGAPLAMSQEQITRSGHSIECRIYAENTGAGFLPDTGHLTDYSPPAGGWVRLDAAVEAGSEISIYYDPMISKLSVFGRTREEALNRMARALSEYRIVGVETNIGFCEFVLAHNDFRVGRYNTHFIDLNFDPEACDKPEPEDLTAAVIGGLLLRNEEADSQPQLSTTTVTDSNQWKWKYRR